VSGHARAPAVEVSHLVKAFRDKKAVDDVSLRWTRGRSSA